VLVPRSNASREAPSGAVEGGATRDVLVARLRESEGRFELLAESAPVLIWMTDLVQGCTYVNQRYVDFTGRRRDEEHGRRWVDVVHPDDVERVRKTFEHAVAERREFEAEYRLRRADGVYRWILASGMPRLGPDGTPIGYVGSAIDISERKQAERAGLLLLERERAARAAAQADSQAKERFLAELAHDLRSPLGAVVAWAELLLNRELDPPTSQRGLAAIARGARTLSRLIDDLPQRGINGTKRPEPEPLRARALAGRHVLVVDDDAEARDVLRLVLEEAGAKATAVASVADAVAVFDRESIDVLVSDIGMPAEDGYSLLRRVRASGDARVASIPAIALTAFAGPEHRARAFAAGFQTHLPKPVAPSELVGAVQSVLPRA
jgi:PAS domain S-box-containing protein